MTNCALITQQVPSLSWGFVEQLHEPFEYGQPLNRDVGGKALRALHREIILRLSISFIQSPCGYPTLTVHNPGKMRGSGYPARGEPWSRLKKSYSTLHFLQLLPALFHLIASSMGEVFRFVFMLAHTLPSKGTSSPPFRLDSSQMKTAFRWPFRPAPLWFLSCRRDCLRHCRLALSVKRQGPAVTAQPTRRVVISVAIFYAGSAVLRSDEKLGFSTLIRTGPNALIGFWCRKRPGLPRDDS